MINNNALHTFHIPVMGTGFTIDTPIKVAQYGISSVISLVDDILMEKLRELYSQKFRIPFQEITDKMDDFRAKRITAYLNLVKKIVEEKFEELKNSLLEKGSEIEKFIEMLPDFSLLKQQYQQMRLKNLTFEDMRNWVDAYLQPGSIDVNIMTKLDKENYKHDEKLPVEYNDAHAALRGFANSDLQSSIVLSAGMNPRLYSYFEKFDDFYPDENGFIKKKVTLKVSDFRSAFIQGKFLAKKGIWVSEYRYESGLNCGGHAFASEGYLMGPALEEFKDKKEYLIETTFAILVDALKNKNRSCPNTPPEIKITAQGGVGTSEEHNFLLDHYSLDSIGWGTPFLLVPEVSNVDKETLDQLCKATEDDLYLSDISPLGVPFNSLRNNSQDKEKQAKIDKGRPGSSCPKKYASILHSPYQEKSICTASRKYQNIKIKELEELNLPEDEHKTAFDKIVDKACICIGLSQSTMIVNDLEKSAVSRGVSICPGPNMAYFNKIVTLKDMVNHIYGKISIIKDCDRPNLFIKELKLYIAFLRSKINDAPKPFSVKQVKYFAEFQENISKGIEYYKELFNEYMQRLEFLNEGVMNELEALSLELNEIEYEEALEYVS